MQTAEDVCQIMPAILLSYWQKSCVHAGNWQLRICVYLLLLKKMISRSWFFTGDAVTDILRTALPSWQTTGKNDDCRDHCPPQISSITFTTCS